ncbi:MAG TPA: hypothetical protein VFE33_02665 [Thermoanaerobaculia bacterium]|nr:hypothetical protein [Thermoanaerobaculia bacterium]
MSSKKTTDLLFLERDLQLTEDDFRAMRENRPRAWVNWWDQLTTLSEQFPASVEQLRRRSTFEGYEPFEL